MKPLAFALMFVALTVYDLMATKWRGEEYEGEIVVGLMSIAAFAGVIFS